MSSQTTHQTDKNEESSAEVFAHWLDDRFKIPGTDIRFGVDPLVSIIPGTGDWLSGLLSSYFIVIGAREGVAPSVLLRMGFNIILDLLFGLVPVLGDIFDFGWKANTKNVALLRKYQDEASSTEKQSKLLLWLIAIMLIVIIFALLILIGWLISLVVAAIF